MSSRKCKLFQIFWRLLIRNSLPHWKIRHLREFYSLPNRLEHSYILTLFFILSLVISCICETNPGGCTFFENKLLVEEEEILTTSVRFICTVFTSPRKWIQQCEQIFYFSLLVVKTRRRVSNVLLERKYIFLEEFF